MELSVGDRSFRAIDLEATVRNFGVHLQDMPRVIRVLAENLLRAHTLRGANVVGIDEIDAVMAWRDNVGADLSLYVSRVILPDSSGVPVLQDLAALREEVRDRGGDPARVDAVLPLDLVIDHSLQVDRWGTPDAIVFNMKREIERNAERYEFLRWCRANFAGITVHPPGSGIIHQVNLERVAPVVCTRQIEDGTWAYPDFVLGGDSHTPMVNALGVLGWGVGGIDAEAALLGEAYAFALPEVVGVELEGVPPAGTFTTDVALMITQRLRAEKVTHCAVEFFGGAVARLSIPERATIANMAPEYGATCGYFAIDDSTLSYLRATGRSDAQVALVATYAKRAGLFRDDDDAVCYTRRIRIDLADAFPSIAGPMRPQQRLRLAEVGPDFRRRLAASIGDGGFARRDDMSAAPMQPGHGAIAIAAITSCTNTSNPQVMIAAGLTARNCVRLGLKPPPWVKTSLAPGSISVTRYLDAMGLLAPLRALGFELIGYGCTTCGGKSGPLVPELAAQIEQLGLVAAAVLSGNRNFPGRIHKLVQANYLMAPPLVVAYTVAGRIDFDPETEPLAADAQGHPVYLRDVLPSGAEVDALLPQANAPEHYAAAGGAHADSFWERGADPAMPVFQWASTSTYLVKPPFFAASTDEASNGIERLSRPLRNARVLLLLDSAVTTDHISPSGEIPADSPSGRYLIEQGVAPKDFNTYVGRRGNHHVMVRGTFANIRIRNQLTPNREGGWTLKFPERQVVTIFDAATRYQQQDLGLIVLAGAEYGTGSSRDWAAKGTALLGVQAVIAESFERIHRANLIGMGVLPLRFRDGEGWRQLGLDGSERFSFDGVAGGVQSGAAIRVRAERGDGSAIQFDAIPEMRTAAERLLMAAGGLPQRVLNDLLGEAH